MEVLSLQYLDVTVVVTTDGSIFNTILLFLQLLLQLSYHLEVLSLQYYFFDCCCYCCLDSRWKYCYYYNIIFKCFVTVHVLTDGIVLIIILFFSVVVIADRGIVIIIQLFFCCCCYCCCESRWMD